jgi:hypothetical protein
MTDVDLDEIRPTAWRGKRRIFILSLCFPLFLVAFAMTSDVLSPWVRWGLFFAYFVAATWTNDRCPACDGDFYRQSLLSFRSPWRMQCVTCDARIGSLKRTRPRAAQ